MDGSSDDVPANVVHDSSGRDSSSSDIFEPLSALLMKPKNVEKQSYDDSSDDEPLIKMKTASASAKTPEKKENKSSKPNGTNNNADPNTDESSDSEPLIKIAKVSSKAAKKSFSVPLRKTVDKKKEASDDSSDDEPLIKQKFTSATAKKSEEKEKKSSRSNGTYNSKAGGDITMSSTMSYICFVFGVKCKFLLYAPFSDLNTDESSDSEPLIKIAKVSSKAAKKSFSVSPKKSADKKKESPADGDSSENEPLSKIAKKLQSQHQRKASVTPSRKETPVMKSKRSAAKKMVTYAESSSDSSDEEPLATIKKATMSSDTKKTKTKDNSSDDDVPLVNLIAKKKPLKKNTKKETVSKKKRQGVSDSSDDEPLINIVKKNPTGGQTKNKTKASAPKKRNTTPKKPRKMTVSGMSSRSSADEPLIKAAKHPQVTKILRIILERCDGEDAGTTGSLIKTKTGKTQLAEESGDSKEESEGLKADSEGSGESSEKE